MVRKAVQPIGATEASAQGRRDIGEHLGSGAGHRRIPIRGRAGIGQQRGRVTGFWGGAGRVLGCGHQTGNHPRVDFRRDHCANGGAITFAHNRNHGGAAADRDPVGGHRVARPAQGGLNLLGDQDHGLVGAAKFRRFVQDDVDDVLRSDHRPPSVRVLSTLTPRNNAAGQPWLTAATCPGCALPQLNAPPSRQVDGPPTASMEFQKSVVVA